MKSLWSKIGQTHHCGCQACKTAVHGAGRRVTAAPRRKVTFTDIFTAAYSSVFASAAVVDAIHKEDRRKELDRQLDEARRDLAELREQNRIIPDDDRIHDSAESNIARLTTAQMVELWSSLRTIVATRPYFKEIDLPPVLRESELREKLQMEHYNCPDATYMDMSRRTDLKSLEQHMIAEESDPSIPQRLPRSPHEMQQLRQEIARLVKGMMYRVGANVEEFAVPSPSFEAACKLLEEDYPQYSHPNVDPERANEALRRLNRTNRSVINDEHLGMKEKVGRVCYNLLIARFPPNMPSFNSLIASFDKDALYSRVSEQVVSTFYHHVQFWPTPSTFPAILHHYKVTNNHGSFVRTLRCIIGHDQVSGAKYGRIPTHNLEDPNIRDDVLRDPKLAVGERFTWQRAPLNRLMVDEILRGLLHFHMLDGAVAFLASCVSSGVHVASGTVKHVLDECLVALDWKAAVKLLHELVSKPRLWGLMLKARNDSTRAYLIDRVYSLLDMIGLDMSGETISDQGMQRLSISREQFDGLKAKVQRQNLKLPRSLVVSPARGTTGADPALKSRMLQIESIDKELTRIRKTLKSLDIKFLKRDMDESFVYSMTPRVCDLVIEDAQFLAQEVMETLERIATTTEATIEAGESPMVQEETIDKDLKRVQEAIQSLDSRLLEADTESSLSPAVIRTSSMTLGNAQLLSHQVSEALSSIKQRRLLEVAASETIHQDAALRVRVPAHPMSSYKPKPRRKQVPVEVAEDQNGESSAAYDRFFGAFASRRTGFSPSAQRT